MNAAGARFTGHGHAPHGHYGIDAPLIPLSYALGAVVALVVAAFAVARGWGASLWTPLAICLALLMCAALFLHASLRGKRRAWRQQLDELDLQPGCRVLDLGCGRGAVLMALAHRIAPPGRAVGVDLWHNIDQFGNAPAAAEHNAEVEGVEDRVQLCTGDITALPFADDSFDLIVSSLAIHNIAAPQDRTTAVREAVRVLRPGGTLAIMDLSFARRYLDALRDPPMRDLRVRDLGWRMWWTGPWMRTWLATATKAESEQVPGGGSQVA
ncbi:class I SAM-dependent methyltransferase [Speluncibacter jeojiensis]|uniref:Class I SAM-dependent methyltransferase n=1 Tax=Speluncibacter jeojiensis TaxID=2710754 RepID=A0A9X4LZB0_9ACTN|nr:class I SAM-dependent methyltransferase [Corynebacteriales bacterium D3-21]